MPIYEYGCQDCSASFEKLVVTIRETVSCPRCESIRVDRKVSVFNSPGNRGEDAVSGGGCGCTPATCGCR